MEPFKIRHIQISTVGDSDPVGLGLSLGIFFLSSTGDSDSVPKP